MVQNQNTGPHSSLQTCYRSGVLSVSRSRRLQRLTVDQTLSPARISEYECGSSIPSHWMAYGRTARLPVEILIDEEFSPNLYQVNSISILTTTRKYRLRSSARVELFILEGTRF